jgi:hypothetical protein
MSSSIVEQIRVNHELSELYEQAICKELDEKPSGVSLTYCKISENLKLRF